MPYYYSWCDCMCTPSRWEGFGYVFIEAAACESAIVTSDIGPMNEYLTNGKDSLLVAYYENPEKIAETCLKVCSNSKEVIEMKKAARQVGLRFEKSKVDKQEIEIYKKVIGKDSGNQYCFDLRKVKRTLLYK
ncbi:MAG: glycosyltransferase [Butyrivibrio sp.]|nr:glycosyltransferase [Butyrivibrio sp.]